MVSLAWNFLLTTFHSNRSSNASGRASFAEPIRIIVLSVGKTSYPIYSSTIGSLLAKIHAPWAGHLTELHLLFASSVTFHVKLVKTRVKEVMWVDAWLATKVTISSNPLKAIQVSVSSSVPKVSSMMVQVLAYLVILSVVNVKARQITVLPANLMENCLSCIKRLASLNVQWITLTWQVFVRLVCHLVLLAQ